MTFVTMYMGTKGKAMLYNGTKDRLVDGKQAVQMIGVMTPTTASIQIALSVSPCQI